MEFSYTLDIRLSVPEQSPVNLLTKPLYFSNPLFEGNIVYCGGVRIGKALEIHASGTLPREGITRAPEIPGRAVVRADPQFEQDYFDRKLDRLLERIVNGALPSMR